ncbi:hypothetical protein SAMN05428945_3014 [Streptomyces sp. 2224.1]|nr:hypothetical protein BX261_2297 [Streptomyces sp. 2321.6]SDR49839.1 hypothetical protein SAMN05216511_4909 [Streptomyces sp. KS_16]SEC47874.1 hypothetical protein SAMN05428945_3014 [Streptomyces sp. 2224.1]SEC56468.1 hypothetical protein SAMN05428940_2299 [Streptomyces sp. 2133.1]SNC68336.1 hypothetical protein SAMN06272741_2294 [Streptomyces sp. 2114.4]
MHKAIRRLAAATGVLVAAGALPIVATAPAQATTKQCTSFLAEGGYKVGPKVRAACKMTGEGGLIERNNNVPFCQAYLITIKVDSRIAERACQLGADGPSSHV